MFLLLTAAVIVAVLSVTMLLYRVVVRAHQNPRPGLAGASSPGHGPVARVVLGAVTTVIRGLLRLGFGVGPMMMLTVPGRTTGRPRTNPVDLFQEGGRSWLVATHTAHASWVRNLRVSGTGELSRGRSRLAFTAVELSSDDAAVVLRDVIGPRLARPVAGSVLRQAIHVTPQAPLEDFARVATDHPVFELTLATVGPARSGATTEGRRASVPTLIIGGLALALTHTVLGITTVMTAPQWISGVAVGLLLAGLGNHLRIFSPR